jgi:CHAD domain-containing protein
MHRPAAPDLFIRQRLRALEKHLPAAANGNADALHQARVASRRVREALPLLSSGGRARRLERQVRRITRALGPVRELDVALRILDDVAKSGDAPRPAVARLREAVALERRLLQADMRRRLEACDLEKLRRKAAGAARKDATPATRDPRRLERARERAARRAARLRAAIATAGSVYLPDRLHEVRIAVKKLRYALELVRELSRSKAAAKLRSLRHVQDLLGRMHDLEVLIARTRAVQGAQGAPTLELSGEMDRLVRRFETECRQLHAQYMAARAALLAICDQAARPGARRGRHAA